MWAGVDVGARRLHVVVVDGALRVVTAEVVPASDTGLALELMGSIAGVAVDSLRTLARYLVQAEGHHRLVIDPAVENRRAIACYRKVGFQPVGVMRRYERGADGTFHDSLLMDMLATELQ